MEKCNHSFVLVKQKWEADLFCCARCGLIKNIIEGIKYLISTGEIE